MERVTQMSVIPDVMPRVEPTIDLQVSYGQAAVIPGNYLLPSQTVEQPRLKVQSFEAEEGLHTLLMVDPGEWSLIASGVSCTLTPFGKYLRRTRLGYSVLPAILSLDRVSSSKASVPIYFKADDAHSLTAQTSSSHHLQPSSTFPTLCFHTAHHTRSPPRLTIVTR